MQKSVDKLLVDVEGSEYKILYPIDYKKILIKEIIFEKKHLDGTFTEGKKLEKLKEVLKLNNYTVNDINKENCLATKLI